MKKPLIIANWKMNPATLGEAVSLAKRIEKSAGEANGVKVVIAPPVPFAADIGKILKKAGLGAQDVFWERVGAFTGAVSWAQLRSVGVTYVIVGHSETRAMAGQSDEDAGKKIKALLENKMIPILCVGERERAEGGPSAVVGEMLSRALKDIKKNLAKNLIVAYEPVWAISTTPGAEPDAPANCVRAMMYLRRILTELYDRKTAEAVRIIYGGSVNAANAEGFLKGGKMDGALIGKASIDPEEFSRIIRCASPLR